MKHLSFILFFTFSTFLFSQNKDAKRDYIWLYGYDSAYNSTKPDFGNGIINFNTQPKISSFKYTDMNFNDDIAMICDTTGKLLFYTNGIYIADSTHQPMKNGDGLNPGKLANTNKKGGYINCQGSIILPKPNSNNLFYLIHSSLIFDTSIDGYYRGEYLYYTLIDMSKNNGKGEVVEKNKILLILHRIRFYPFSERYLCYQTFGN
jgi:hypothetical protein